ncbi:BON domain-containing protein [Paraburkholderia pallida]|uniref:BON domain-containing protein n=1 Tax=Paraburkholderia pallida TaxID=2547399 RepID=A0A4P7D4P0_9BURK|nr:BON domain-containing protein [Paraburkholderia pallida]QBR03659.1 BON domain-containing protein [Paraburkholderia pallida]
MKNRYIPLLFALLAAQTLLSTTPTFAQPQAPQGASLPSLRDLKHPSPEDKQLIKAVRRKLSRTAGLNPSSVSVLAHNGIIVLTGTVPTQDEIGLATSAASQVPGVTSVIDKLTIRAPI